MLVWGVWRCDTDTVTSKPPPGRLERETFRYTVLSPATRVLVTVVLILIFSSPHICTAAGDARGRL